MKLVKNFLFAVLLVSLMAVSTPAGEQNTPGYTCVPTATNNCEQEATSGDSDVEDNGEITTDSTDYLLYEAWSALLSVY